MSSHTSRLKRTTLRELWSDLRESVSGSEKDFTRIPLGKAILLLSVPMVLEMMMESVFALVDIYFVSRMGADEVAVVGITEGFMTVIYSVAMGLSVGTTALVSRRIGEKKNREATVSAVQAILASLGVSLLFSLIGILFAGDLLRLMGTPEELIEDGYIYPMIMLGGNGVIILLFVMNAVFRSSGDAAISMRVLGLANLLNIILDPLLIFGIGPFPELGLKGAAIATTTGRGVAVLYQVYLLGRGHNRIRVTLDVLVVRLQTIWQVIRLSLGAVGQNLIGTASWIFLISVITHLGEDIVAGYTVAIRLILFILLPAFGMANAAATLVGQNLGAGQPERAERSAWVAGVVNMIFLGCISVFFIAFPSWFVGFFIGDAGSPRALEAGIVCLRLISFGFLIYALGMVMVQSINGAGDTATPVWINIIAFWLAEIPLAWFFTSVLEMGVYGVCYAILIGETTLTMLSMFIFRRGKWKLKKV